MPKIDNNFFYTDSILKHGISPQGVRWNSKQNQYKRFEVLTSFIPDIQDSSVVDAGCGFGEYYIYLQESNQLPRQYIGIDVEEQMIQSAMSRIDAPFYVKDIINQELPHSDYYVCSGAMNIMTKDESLEFIYNIYKHSIKGVVFNLLQSSFVSNHDVYNSFSIYEALTYCKTFSKNIEFKADYIDGDFTIFIDKKGDLQSE
jgi:SAM-dependent methyltransferase